MGNFDELLYGLAVIYVYLALGSKWTSLLRVLASNGSLCPFSRLFLPLHHSIYTITSILNKDSEKQKSGRIREMARNKHTCMSCAHLCVPKVYSVGEGFAYCLWKEQMTVVPACNPFY